MTEPIPFLDRLGEQLQRATPPPRRRPAPLVLSIVVLVALAFVAVAALRPSPATADIDVSIGRGRIELRVRGVAPPAAEIEKIAHRNGLDIDVVEVATGPSSVGRFFTVGVAPAGLDLDRSTRGSSYLSLPVNWKGVVTLQIGRAARPGETYGQPSDALGVDEPLDCAELDDTPPARVAAVVEARHLRARWFVGDEGKGVPSREVDLAEALRAPYATYRLAQAWTIDARTVFVQLSPDGRASVFIPEAVHPPC